MSEIAASTTSPVEAPAKQGVLRLLLVNLPYLILYAIALWLIALTDSNPLKAAFQWQLFIPLVALVSVVDGWKDTRDTKPVYLLQQFLHWGSLMVLTWLLFLPEIQQFLNADSQGFLLATMLGLTAILSGIYFEWKLAVFGAFLIASAVGVAYLTDNALLLAMLGGTVAAVAITLLIRKHRRAQP